MIEFYADADVRTVESILFDAGRSGNFEMKPDRFKRSTDKHRKYTLHFGNNHGGHPVECGSVELISKKENRVLVKVNRGGHSAGPTEEDTVIAVDRFFYLVTQRLLQEKVVSVNIFENTSEGKT